MIQSRNNSQSHYFSNIANSILSNSQVSQSTMSTPKISPILLETQQSRKRTDSLDFKSVQHLYIPFGLQDVRPERECRFKFRRLSQPIQENTSESINKGKSILKQRSEGDRPSKKQVNFRDTTNILTMDGHYMKDYLTDSKKRESRRTKLPKYMISLN